MSETANAVKNYTILIVDDTPDNLALLNEMLKEQYCIKIAIDGIKALRIAASDTPPNLILLDIMMPEMDGYTVCQKLKAIPSLQDIPVIFISALTDTDAIVRSFKSGGVDYITKPFQAEEVLARVSLHLEVNHAKTELQSMLSKTLSGTIRLMLDILTLLHPLVVEQANRIRRYSNEMMKYMLMGPQEGWVIDFAIMLSSIGCVNISPEVLNRKFTKNIFSYEDTKRFEQHPQIGADLISRIPRLEKVAAIIRNQLIHPSKLQGDLPDTVYIGSAMLNILLAYDTFVYNHGMAPISALIRLRSMIPSYPKNVLDSLEAAINNDTSATVKTVLIGELIPGMILCEDIYSKNGVVLLTKGTEFSASIIQLLHRFLEQKRCKKVNIEVFEKK